MSSNISIQRICQHCGFEFTAKTTTTHYCSKKCNADAYKAKLRNDKVEKSNKETKLIKAKSVIDLQAKEFLSVREVAVLMNCSIRSVYYYVKSGNINSVNLGKRITRIKRSNIDKLFQIQNDTLTPVTVKKEPVKYEVEDCYTLTDVQNKYGISETALQQLVIRHDIPKIKIGRYAYVPKEIIAKLLN